ncbi:MAG: preprotein translocase subunit SecY [Candidatus Magasanikbacteria bacterium RIFOXYC2_FULL_40_16]|uniref:Protein translocase subunit SecY n=3 Tax=Candidatus Magasanikiibacteriota TaxID=1752731 RepID=A0A1F6NHB4_9BACT|nr:MAG: preprotein translocase subunit SecY [Candidatus Magasanikbacteria bacterium RIFOXYA2_FULL_40_20]OGH83232.1 MAG: preprotein translocase subunit SecY [Candidatus Magasanikbacteria bacterium RIFOXYB1_FULL_40_15]OGH85164.1 MAG: preprotein translocase subunit SecY [Candidatus Magasanikbacteria bacterium RIFOXYB2_FULL_40_13]OGH87070.1 MAG: preprotein translocase subunit SecY [Candidatus Magasanikbacteria bacterium RIFOXYA1_FULL_40_8]OGH89515.1 MAG: preprotein translocase subunit SecY [Candida
MWEKLRKIWNVKSLRNSILYVLGMLIIFRLVAHIPMPGIDREALSGFLAGNQILGLLNVFSGGTIENFSLVMMGIAPYITSSIIFQLLTMVVPSLEELSKEGESGQQKINMYTRITTVPLALLQAYGFIKLLNNSQQGMLGDLTTVRLASMMLFVTAGTIFLMWIGELITEKKIGNGISLLIFAGIVASLPTAIRNAVVNYNPSDLTTYLLFAGIAVATIIGVVIINEGQRNIPISYAKQVRVGQGGAKSHLPLRVNMAGVIPIIFAISIVLFPSMVAQFFAGNQGWLGRVAISTINLFQNQLFYGMIYFLLVFGFTYFYTAVIFNPEKIAENLQRQGGFIPGIRPGKQTEEYLQKTMTRLVFVGALFLGAIAVLPLLMQLVTNSQALVFGGTSLLIVVSVAIETTKQIDSQLTVHEYDGIK